MSRFMFLIAALAAAAFGIAVPAANGMSGMKSRPEKPSVSEAQTVRSTLTAPTGTVVPADRLAMDVNPSRAAVRRGIRSRACPHPLCEPGFFPSVRSKPISLQDCP